MELSKTFEPKAVEHWSKVWEDLGYFKADPAKPGEAFSIVIPPPNVTGQLHLGHALNVTLHDVIVRMRRMQGYNTLWLPGTDHAGIATQNVVERELKKEGKTRHDLGREKFVERVWQWRETYGGKILNQLRKLGASCDWSRERFTLDEGLSRAVTKVFVALYYEGLIYRDYRLINWCPRCETALSDLEVEHKESNGHLWYIRYPLTDGSGAITVATTRPETMLGDTAVAVNPEDERYRALIGKTVRVPLTNREIPIIADAAVDKSFGTGAVKITPAHDFNDFEMGRRHNLPQIQVIDTHGQMTVEAGIYQGLSREECRKRVVADLEAQALLEKTDAHKHAVGVCSRCDTVVEPMLSYQWFLAVNKLDHEGKSLGGEAITAVEQGQTKFFPKRWENTYFSWMRNLQDWCISRQLWWGHRIPAWWCDNKDCGQAGTPIVQETAPANCGKCSGPLRQDDDVLDTWFSSGLWPFSTLGWPDKTADLERYYPTSLLITGFDIIFFWVARMMMFGIKMNPNHAESMADKVPFKDIYITPLVRDQYGKKMTKSRGNVVDPLDIMEKYGTDAVRFTLAQLSVQGRDLILSDDRLAASRAFANKIWNAARFVLMNLEGAPQPLPPIEIEKLGLAERWILSRLDAAIAKVTKEIDAYEFNNAALTVYQFIWHEFCDWYIELSKEPLKAGGERQAAARYVLVTCFDRMLRILHPFMPFISEEIWLSMRPYLKTTERAHLAVAPWPRTSERDPMSEHDRELIGYALEVTERLNSLRSLVGYQPAQKAEALIRPIVFAEGPVQSAKLISDATTQFVNDSLVWRPYVVQMAKLQDLGILQEGVEPPHRTLSVRVDWGEVHLREPQGFDRGKVLATLQKKREEAEVHRNRLQERLANPDFLKAGLDKVSETEERVADLWRELGFLEEQLVALSNSQHHGTTPTNRSH